MNTLSRRIHFDSPPRVDTVTLAVIPIDVFSGRTVTAGVKASVDGLLSRPVKNLSGHLVFLNLPAQAQYVVKVDAADARYLPTADTIFVPPQPSDTDPAKRRHLVRLTPRPDFPFGAETTLVRGVIRRGSADDAPPVRNARVWIDALLDPPPPQNPGDPAPDPLPPFETRSDARGAFALPISIPDAENALANAQAVDGKIEIIIHFAEGGDARDLTCKVRDGKSHSFLDPIDLIGTNQPEFFDPSQP